ncbi:MAG: helix-turn-helix domain-containing protein [Thiolinea sp.]
MAEPLIIVRPAPALQAYVSHYWLSCDNTDPLYTILPDGAIDLVIWADPDHYHASVYGTTTRCRDVPLRQVSHYLGIRFRPGQSRFFLQAAACELTDRQQAAGDLMGLELDALVACIRDDQSLFAHLDQLLLRHLQTHRPQSSRLDEVIRQLESSRGKLSMTTCASLYGRSLRQFERQFRDAVGIPAKLFAQIQRFQSAAAQLRTGQSLSHIATDLGYADQSHMSHAFKRFAGVSPTAFTRQYDVFLQDPTR